MIRYLTAIWAALICLSQTTVLQAKDFANRDTSAFERASVQIGYQLRSSHRSIDIGRFTNFEENASLDQQPAQDSDKITSENGVKLRALNLKLASLLKPFNTATRQITLTFLGLASNVRRATHWALELSINRTGVKLPYSIKISQLAYTYPENAGSKPELKLQLSAVFDVYAFIPREIINSLGESDEKNSGDTLKGLTAANPQAAQYAEGLKIDVQGKKIEKDSNGNVSLISFKANATLDPSKLPPGETASFKNLSLDLKLTPKTIDIAFSIELNPDSKEFQKGQKDLKATVDKLLASDPATINKIRDTIRELVKAADNAAK